MDMKLLLLIKPRYSQLLAEGRSMRDALFEAVRGAMLQGELNQGDRLPATRELAGELGISRGTVNAVYDMLYADGYIRSETGRGTFAAYRQASLSTAWREDTTDAAIMLSTWGQRIMDDAFISESFDTFATEPMLELDLRVGRTDMSAFPAGEWKRAVYAAVREFTERERANAFATEGHEGLRRAIAAHLARERGIQAEARQIAVTNGSMQAIALLAMLLIEEGGQAVIENPSFTGIRRSIRAAGGVPLPAAVDKSGIVPADWQAKLLFVTPSRQFPTGAVLPLERRIALLEWASRRDAVIVEDDYDSEFRWGGRPIEPLKAMDREGRIVYVGSFSKSLHADVRIGYAVLPERLVEPFRRAKFWTEPHPTGLVWQRALASFMADGEYARHLRRMQRIYGRRLEQFRTRAEEALSEWFDMYPAEAGLHVYGEWRGAPASYDRLAEACRQAGVVWSGGRRHWFEEEPARRSALFGFAHLDEPCIDEAVSRIRAAAEGLSGIT